MYIKIIITADRLLKSVRFVDDLEANLLDDNVNYSSYFEIPINPAPPYTPGPTSAHLNNTLTSTHPSSLHPYLHIDTDAPPSYCQQTT